MRIGHGYDVHRLVLGRALILGGVKIPHEKGLLGHSDADVLTHAVMDALLGAAALGDIGTLFPDSDPAFAGADSLRLLKEVGRRIEKPVIRSEILTRHCLPKRQKSRRISGRCGKIWPERCPCRSQISASKPPRRKVSALPAPEKAWPPTRLHCSSRGESSDRSKRKNPPGP